MTNSFQWPTPGEKAFKIKKRSWANSELEQNAKRRDYLIAAGYKSLADIGIDHILSSGDTFHRDTMIYPILFNYRHFLEISMKLFISEFHEEANVSKPKVDHRLAPLWTAYSEIVERIATDSVNKESDEIVRSIISEFDKLDPNSFAMRYATDRKNEAIQLPRKLIDLTNLKSTMTSVGNFFDGCTGYISELTQCFD